MGGSRSASVDWGNYSSSSTTQSQSFTQAYTNTSGIQDEFHPSKMKPLSAAEPHLQIAGMEHVPMRVCDKSDANPEPTPIIMGLDCTGSMNDVALAAKKSFGTLMKELYDRRPVTDPAILCAFLDDVYASRGQALQITQFESDMVILDQMEKLYWVGNGGGNGSESYNLPLHFAINHTRCVSFDEGRKGFIFTLGDDGVPPALTTNDLRTIYGQDYPETEPLSYETLVEQASEHWHVFHIGVKGMQNNARWSQVLGERFISLSDISKLAEVMVALMQVIQGADKAAVAASFTDPGTSLVVANAIKDLTPQSHGGGVVRL